MLPLSNRTDVSWQRVDPSHIECPGAQSTEGLFELVQCVAEPMHCRGYISRAEHSGLVFRMRQHVPRVYRGPNTGALGRLLTGDRSLRRSAAKALLHRTRTFKVTPHSMFA